MFRFLDLDHLAELGRLGGVAFADGLNVLFKQAQQFVLEMGVALDHPSLRLFQNALGQLTEMLQLLGPSFQPNLPQACLIPLPTSFTKVFACLTTWRVVSM